jgi:hypothetical protein
MQQKLGLRRMFVVKEVACYIFYREAIRYGVQQARGLV